LGARVSVIIPMLNEEANIERLHGELASVLRSLGSSEIVYVDDGSTDGTFALLQRIAVSDEGQPGVKVVRLRRSFGQTAGLAAGLAVSDGEIVVFMDGDGQNDPADIPTLLRHIDEGYDVVSGWRQDRKDKLLSRRLPSMMANRLISLVTGVKLHDYGCSLKAYRREVIEGTRLYGEMHRFIPALVAWHGARIKEVAVNHRARIAGRSKYGIGRTFKVVLDLITVKFLSAFSTKPIHVFGAAGLAALAGAAGTAAFALYERISQNIYVHRNPLFTISIFLGVVGTQLILIGLIAELVTRTYHESQGKPIYVVRETINVRAD